MASLNNASMHGKSMAVWNGDFPIEQKDLSLWYDGIEVMQKAAANIVGN